MSLLARNTIALTIAKFFSVAIYAIFGLALPVFLGDGNASKVGLYTLLSTLLLFGKHPRVTLVARRDAHVFHPDVRADSSLFVGLRFSLAS